MKLTKKTLLKSAREQHVILSQIKVTRLRCGEFRLKFRKQQVLKYLSAAELEAHWVDLYVRRFHVDVYKILRGFNCNYWGYETKKCGARYYTGKPRKKILPGPMEQPLWIINEVYVRPAAVETAKDLISLHDEGSGDVNN